MKIPKLIQVDSQREKAIELFNSLKTYPIHDHTTRDNHPTGLLSMNPCIDYVFVFSTSYGTDRDSILLNYHHISENRLIDNLSNMSLESILNIEVIAPSMTIIDFIFKIQRDSEDYMRAIRGTMMWERLRSKNLLYYL